MTTIMTLAVKLTADAQQYMRALGDAEKRAKFFSSNVSKKIALAGKGFSAAGSMMGNAFTAGTKIVVRAVKRIGATALKTAKIAIGAFSAISTAAIALGTKAFLAAAKVDELRIVNNVLAKNAGLSLKAVRAEAREVKNMGIEAATSERIVSEFIKANLELGKASDIARIAQDAAVISQSNSSEAAAQITLGIAKMNPLILRNQGIIVDAQVAYEKYGASIGKSATELTKAEKQQAFLNAVIEQGEKIAGSYEAAMKEPGKVLRSIPRHINEISIAIGSVLKPMFGETVFAISDFVKKIEAAVEEGGALRPILDGVAKALEPLGELFKGVLEGVNFSDVATKMTPFVEGLGEIVDVIVSLISGDTDIGTVFSGLFASIKNAISSFDFGSFLENIIGPNVFSNLLTQDIDIGVIIGGLISNVLANQGKFAEIGLNIINSLLDGIVNAIPKLAETALQILSALIEFITFSLPEIITAAIPLVLALATGILQALPLIVEAALQIIISLAIGLSQALPTLIPTIVDVLLRIISVLIDNLPMLIEASLALIVALAEGIIQALPVLIAALPQIITTILNALIDALPMILNASGELIGMLATGIVVNIPLIIMAVGELIVGVATALANWVATMPEIGRSLLDGIWTGITNNADKFWEKVKSFFSDIVIRIKEMMGISSPSKVFRDQIGLNMALGVVAGWEDGLQGNLFRPALAPALSAPIPVPQANAAVTGAGGGAEDSRLLTALEEFNRRLRNLPDDLARSNESAFQKIIGGGRS